MSRRDVFYWTDPDIRESWIVVSEHLPDGVEGSGLDWVVAVCWQNTPNPWRQSLDEWFGTEAVA